METKNVAPDRGVQNPKRSLFDQPRKVVSGMIYSGTVIGMVLISFVFSVTLAIISVAIEMPVNDIMKTDIYKYFSYVLYQLIFLAVILVFAKVYRQKPCAFGYRKAHPKYFAVALLLAFGLLFSLNWANELFVKLFSLFGYELPPSSLPSLTGGGIVGVLFVVAVLPAFFEETIFRGIILDGIKDIGTVAACLLGGLLFSIFHQSPAQTVYQFICGAAFTLLAIRADSVLPTILIHFVNNAIIIFNERFGFLNGLAPAATITIYVLSALCLVGTLAYLIFFDKKTNRKKEGEIKPFFIPALVGVILCVIMWIANLVSGIAG